MKNFHWRSGPSWVTGATCGLAMLGLLISVSGCNKTPEPVPKPASKEPAATTQKPKQTTPEPKQAAEGKPGETASVVKEILVSGLQPGDYPDVFYVKDITGPAAGLSLCYRCRYGARPVINVFARTITDELTSLVKQINRTVADNRDARLASFVVFLTDDPDSEEPDIKKLAESAGIDATPLTIFEGATGPSNYHIAQEAAVTVLMWREGKVMFNFAFREGELNSAKIEEMIAAAGKMTVQ